MAAPTNTFQTYQAIGNREDLLDVVTNISPTDTWCLSNFGRSSATSTLHEWTTDALATPAANAVIEGDDASASAITARTRVNNYTQISRKTYIISDTQMAVNASGGPEETRQKANKLKELANDIEFAIVTNSAAAAGASGTARQTKGAIGWIATNVTTSSASTLTDVLLNTNLQLVWAAGGKPSNILCGGARKADISGFTGNTKNVSAEKKTLVYAVDIFQSNFGTLTINLSTIMHASHADKLLVFGDINLWNLAWLRPINYEKLYRSGGATRYMIEAEYAVECLQEKGSGKIDLA